MLQRRMKPLVVVFCQVFVARRKSQSSLTGGEWLSVDSEYSIIFSTQVHDMSCDRACKKNK